MAILQCVSVVSAYVRQTASTDWRCRSKMNMMNVVFKCISAFCCNEKKKTYIYINEWDSAIKLFGPLQPHYQLHPEKGWLLSTSEH